MEMDSSVVATRMPSYAPQTFSSFPEYFDSSGAVVEPGDFFLSVPDAPPARFPAIGAQPGRARWVEPIPTSPDGSGAQNPQSAPPRFLLTYPISPDGLKLPDGQSLLPLPDVCQTTDYSCGASALQTVLKYYGVELSEPELIEILHSDPKEGTHPYSILSVARSLGFEADLRENLTVEDLEASVKKGVPVIVDAQAWRDGADLSKPWSQVWEAGHYMVVIGVDAENVYFEDPSILGSRGMIPRQEFVERWHDYESNGKKFIQSGIFIKGPQPVPPPAYLYVE